MRFLRWLNNQFGASNYDDRDPYRQATVAAGHFVLGGALAVVLPVWWIVGLYVAKEVLSDLRRVWLGSRTKLRNAFLDSVIDTCATSMGVVAVAAPAWTEAAFVALCVLMAVYFVKFAK